MSIKKSRLLSNEVVSTIRDNCRRAFDSDTYKYEMMINAEPFSKILKNNRR